MAYALFPPDNNTERYLHAIGEKLDVLIAELKAELQRSREFNEKLAALIHPPNTVESAQYPPYPTLNYYGLTGEQQYSVAWPIRSDGVCAICGNTGDALAMVDRVFYDPSLPLGTMRHERWCGACNAASPGSGFPMNAAPVIAPVVDFDAVRKPEPQQAALEGNPAPPPPEEVKASFEELQHSFSLPPRETAIDFSDVKPDVKPDVDDTGKHYLVNRLKCACGFAVRPKGLDKLRVHMKEHNPPPCMTAEL